jgi:hypothetical protein
VTADNPTLGMRLDVQSPKELEQVIGTEPRLRVVNIVSDRMMLRFRRGTLFYSGRSGFGSPQVNLLSLL